MNEEEERIARQRAAARRMLESHGQAFDAQVGAATAPPTAGPSLTSSLGEAAAAVPAEAPNPVNRSPLAIDAPAPLAGPAQGPGPGLEGRTVAGQSGNADVPEEGIQVTEQFAGLSTGPNGERIVHLRRGDQERTVVLRDPNNLAADMTAANISTTNQQAVANRLRVDPAPSTQRLPAGNFVSTTVTTSQDGGVRPETAAMATAARTEYERSRAEAQRQEVARADLAARQEREIADLMRRQAEVEQEDIEERTQAVQSRMSQFDEAIDRVANNRIDPEAFFGGDFGRRLGAGIMVAIGSLGSALGGGPNQAMAIINQGIERNMRAQEANQANGRAAAGLEGQSLGMFRAILGDEEAAQAANRAAHLTAAGQRVRAMMAGAAPEQIAGLQGLANAIEQGRMAAAAVAADRGRSHTENTVSVRQAGRPSSMLRAAANLRESTLSPEERQVRSDRRSRSVARRRTLAAGGPAAARIRRRARRAIQVSEEARDALVEDLQERRAAGAAGGVPNYRMNGLFEQDDEQLLNSTRTEAAQTAVREIVTGTAMANHAIDELQRYRRDSDLWGQLTHDEQRAQARIWYNSLRNGYRVAYGVDSVSGPAELEFLNELAGEPLDDAVTDFFSRNRADATLEAQRREINEQARIVAGPYGLTLRTPRDRLQGPGYHRERSTPTTPENRTIPVEDRGETAVGGTALRAVGAALAPGLLPGEAVRAAADEDHPTRRLARRIAAGFTGRRTE